MQAEQIEIRERTAGYFKEKENGKGYQKERDRIQTGYR